ncbi:hypothetical protein RhiirA4_413466 [Rhizophagus irregularis]|uniref:Uncharacterized protein n=1 Tax=Rhizophagus irregularis TaxID=588596 RepID=A0A2I1FTC1_9GLOM|nr:hypothetical protein RhiirA4_413466 [Rhizophagus irregularis]
MDKKKKVDTTNINLLIQEIKEIHNISLNTLNNLNNTTYSTINRVLDKAEDILLVLYDPQSDVICDKRSLGECMIFGILLTIGVVWIFGILLMIGVVWVKCHLSYF